MLWWQSIAFVFDTFSLEREKKHKEKQTWGETYKKKRIGTFRAIRMGR